MITTPDGYWQEQMAKIEREMRKYREEEQKWIDSIEPKRLIPKDQTQISSTS